MSAIGMLLKGRESFDKALEFFRTIVQLDQNNGEAWGNLGTSHSLAHIWQPRANFPLPRSLLFDDGKPPKSLRRLPAGSC